MSARPLELSNARGALDRSIVTLETAVQIRSAGRVIVDESVERPVREASRPTGIAIAVSLVGYDAVLPQQAAHVGPPYLRATPRSYAADGLT